jgi:hypothetical protein
MFRTLTQVLERTTQGEVRRVRCVRRWHRTESAWK